jgi:hypothetical protein
MELNYSADNDSSADLLLPKENRRLVKGVGVTRKIPM